MDPKTVIDDLFQMITEEGFESVFISNANNTKVRAFIGYRKLNLPRTGPVDDLFTFSQFIGQGYARALLENVASWAANEGIKVFTLMVATLHTMHRLYFNKGYYLAYDHFVKQSFDFYRYQYS